MLTSNSDSGNFGLLDARIQRWIWSEGWTSLRDAQERAIPALLAANHDVIIAAATASGKTEAAFFPILTHLLKDEPDFGVVLYISPLKALINDQCGRLGLLCQSLEFPVMAWHGDISATAKKRFLCHPKGVLLITPESLEALFVNRGQVVATLFGNLQYIVIDELHAFIGAERGMQLQSLMHRVEYVIERAVPRIGLSATLGDMRLAAEFLRPGGPERVEIIESRGSGTGLKALIKGYLSSATNLAQTIASEQKSDDAQDKGTLEVAQHLYGVLRGSNNLVFPNSRGKVELYSDLLRQCCEEDGAPNEFYPHYGNLSKTLREETETALKAGNRPVTVICTTTLELGIDIGAVKSMVQIGPPPSVASLRQRVGRSGRRKGEPAILRGYCIEMPIQDDSPISNRLRQGLVQSVAMLRLLVRGWFEPPKAHGLHMSTLVQQVLSHIAQHGGATAGELWRALIDFGPFQNIGGDDFRTLLRSLGDHDLLVQDSSGLLLPGTKGAQFISHYEFYSAFTTEKEYRLLCEGKLLGNLPIAKPLVEGQHLIFAGRRWCVRDIELERQTVLVTPARGGIAPIFDANGACVHDIVRHEMRAVLSEIDIVPILDRQGQALLAEARGEFQSLHLDQTVFVEQGTSTLVFTWAGDDINETLVMLLRHNGIDATNEGIYINVEADVARVTSTFDRIATAPLPPAESVLKNVQNLAQEKWDWTLPKPLLSRAFASLHLDLIGAQRVATSLSSSSPDLSLNRPGIGGGQLV